MSSPTQHVSLRSQKPIRRRHVRWPIRLGRRQGLPTVRLGAKKPRRRGFFMARLCRKAKLKWVMVKYVMMLKKLKKYYDSFVEDLMEGGRTIESFQQRMLLESSFAIPVMGLSFNTVPSSLERQYM